MNIEIGWPHTDDHQGHVYKEREREREHTSVLENEKWDFYTNGSYSVNLTFRGEEAESKLERY